MHGARIAGNIYRDTCAEIGYDIVVIAYSLVYSLDAYELHTIPCV